MKQTKIMIGTGLWHMPMRYFKAANANDQVDADYAHYLKYKATVGLELAYMQTLQDYIRGVRHD